MVICLPTYVTIFSGQLCFWTCCFITLLQSSYFDTIVTFSEELFFAFRSFFSRIATSSRQLFFQKIYLFQSEASTKQPFLLGRGIGENKDIYWRATFLKQVILHRINCCRRDTLWKNVFIRKAIFCITYIFWRTTFSEQLLFQKMLPSISSYLFRNGTFSQLRFFSTATIPIDQLLIVRLAPVTYS